MDRELQSVEFAEKTGVTKRSVRKMTASGPGNMVGVANGRNGEVVVCCVSKRVAMWLARCEGQRHADSVPCAIMAAKEYSYAQ